MMKTSRIAAALSLLALFSSSFPCSFVLAQLPSFLPPPPPTGNPACLAAANNLNTGACHAVAARLKATASSLKDADCEQLGNSEVARTVTAECCVDVRSFVASGCGCDQGVLGLLGAAGIPAAALSAGVKLATVRLGEEEGEDERTNERTNEEKKELTSHHPPPKFPPSLPLSLLGFRLRQRGLWRAPGEQVRRGRGLQGFESGSPCPCLGPCCLGLGRGGGTAVESLLFFSFFLSSFL